MDRRERPNSSRRRDRSASRNRRRHRSPSYDDNDRRSSRKRRHRSRSRSRHRQRRRLEEDEDYRRRRRRSPPPMARYKHDGSERSNSPRDSHRRSSQHRHHRRRKRHRRPSSRRRDHRSFSSSRRRSYDNRSQRNYVAADAPPRAGVVSDDDGGGTAAAKARNSSSGSSSHDDTQGHFMGRDGTVIADRYRILREVGMGTFGRVVECLDLKKHHNRGRGRDRDFIDNSVVALKIVRNVKRYYDSALIEADIVEDVNRRGGRGVSHCARMFDAFSFSGHYCMVFESLGPSLYDFLKRQNYQPFPLMCVRDFAKQLLETLEFLHSFRLIHTDLKPENILLLNGREVSYKGRKIPECTRIKVIDFGGATYDNGKKSSIVNTRQYRAPEVILGTGWSMPSDMWSVGCILAELYQGELLFATHDNIEHLALIEQVIGPFPRRMLKRAKHSQLANEAFDSSGAHRMERVLKSESLAYVKKIGPLESLVFEEDSWLLRLLRQILVTDPEERATARECLRKF